MNKTKSLKNQIGFKLGSTAAILRFFVNSNLKKLNLTVEEVVVLEAIFEKNGKAIKEITEHLPKHKGNITKVMDNLSTKKLIKRKNAEDDRRTINVEVTALGKKTYISSKKNIEASLKKATDGVKNINTIFIALEKIQKNLQTKGNKNNE